MGKPGRPFIVKLYLLGYFDFIQIKQENDS